MEELLEVHVTVPDEALASRLAEMVVSQGLGACVQILGPLKSVYLWQERQESAAEYLLLIKTTRACYPQLEKSIKESHPYEIPEIMALPVVQGYQPYLEWVIKNTQTGT